MDGKADTWEVVGGKKSGKPGETLTKAKKKALLDKMPTIKPSAPVEESTTIYDAFIKSEEKKEQKKALLQQQAASSGQAAAGKKNAPAVGKKDKDNKAEKKKEKPLSLDDAVKKIDMKKFGHVLERSKSLFPNNPDLWLKDLASVLNMELSNIAVENDPVFSSKPWGFPLTKLPEQVQNLMLDTLKRASNEMVDGFVRHCIEEVLEEQNRQSPTIGYRMFIQLVLTNQPLAAVNHLPIYLELLKQNVNRPIRALSIMWCVGQAGLAHLACGLRAWLDIMLPVMNLRNLSNYCMLYLENLLKEHEDNLAGASSSLPKKDFFMLFDQLYSDQPALTAELRNRMRDVYPKLKVVAWGENDDTTLHHLFSSFLTRCTADCSTPRKHELLNCLINCLITDTQSFSIWRQGYTKQLEQSSVLLRHIADNFDKLSSLNGKLLYETVRSFHRTNEQLADDSVSKSQHYRRCVAACEELLAKMSAPKFAWKKLLFLVLAMLLAVVVYDFWLHGSIRKLRTYRTLEEYGVLVFLQHLWQRFLIYYSIVYEWLRINVPYYYAKATEIVGPYATLVWEKLCAGVTALAVSLQPIYEYVKAQMPSVVQWLKEKLPVVLEFIALYIGIVLSVMASAATWLYHHISHFILLAWHWVEHNVLT